MRFRNLLILGIACLMVSIAVARVYAKDKEKESGRMVDSGSFGVFHGGQRVATETFSIQESTSGKIITSELKVQSGADRISQASEWRLSAAGELVRYEWHEENPGKASLTVSPNEQFLIERITTATAEKPAEQPFLMPTSTMMLDNNSFVQREVLAWKYLASACKEVNGETRCSPAPFGVLVPQDRMSLSVTLELVGREKVKVSGVDRDLLRLNMKDDSGQWALWLDDQNMFKLMRILIAANNTEVVRD